MKISNSFNSDDFSDSNFAVKEKIPKKPREWDAPKPRKKGKKDFTDQRKAKRGEE